MRIKSYFDSSIPTAMRQARHEFGDDVMLVTSRIASPEFRYLGDFEVVFAVDESEKGPKAGDAPQPEGPATAFGEMFRLASVVPPAPDVREGAIGRINALLVDVGLEPATTDAMIGLIRSCVLRSTTQPPLTGAAHCAVPSLPGNESVVGYGPVSGVESAADNPPPSDRMPLGPEPATAVPESAAYQPADSRPAPYAGPPPPLRASGVPRQSGFALMLAAFGLYGSIRRSGRKA